MAVAATLPAALERMVAVMPGQRPASGKLRDNRFHLGLQVGVHDVPLKIAAVAACEFNLSHGEQRAAHGRF